MTTDRLARPSRNHTHPSVQILQKATKGTKGQSDNYDSSFPLLPSVKFWDLNLLGIENENENEYENEKEEAGGIGEHTPD